MRNVTSKDPRKQFVVQWFKKYKGAAKVTLVKFDPKQRLFCAHLLERDPVLWGFKSKGMETVAEEIIAKHYGAEWHTACARAEEVA